ncbi:MAG: monovalent cation/H(+) antiporter subunit G [Mariniblastus sp.]|nr:monovalent cation/H(+) antiporter subunit G [Mariniblastus sp.]
MILFNLVVWAFLISGSFFSIVGGVGIIRLPEFYSRLHGGGVTDTLGAGLIIVGLLIHGVGGLFFETDVSVVGQLLTAIKLLMILFFLLITSPASCHALAKSALTQGLKPVLEINTIDKAQNDATEQ